MKNFFIILLLLTSGALGFILSWHNHQPPASSDTSPTTMQTFHYPTLFVNQLHGDPKAGEKIYKEYCASCHAPEPIIDVRAPAMNNPKDWQSRRQIGLDNLLTITVKGIGAMPARGGCFECSDDQLKATIAYMLNMLPKR